MNQGSSKPGADDRDPADNSTDVDAGSKKTPSTDIQPEDVGTPASGNAQRGSAAEKAMKQTSKTGNETGSKR